MPLARINGLLLHFVHVPKTGGASIEDYLSAKGALALKHPTRLGWSATTAQHMSADVHTRLIPPGFCDAAFAVLRDPVARLESEWRWRTDLRQTRAGFDVWARAALQLTRDDPMAHDNHTRPQIDFLAPDLVVFRYSEGLGPIFDWIDAATRTPPGDRELRRNRSRAPRAGIADDVRAEIEAFYADDRALLAAMEYSGLNGVPCGELVKSAVPHRPIAGPTGS